MFPYLHIRLMLGLLILYVSYISISTNYKLRDAVKLLLSINDMDTTLYSIEHVNVHTYHTANYTTHRIGYWNQ